MVYKEGRHANFHLLTYASNLIKK